MKTPKYSVGNQVVIRSTRPHVKGWHKYFNSYLGKTVTVLGIGFMDDDTVVYKFKENPQDNWMPEKFISHIAPEQETQKKEPETVNEWLETLPTGYREAAKKNLVEDPHIKRKSLPEALHAAFCWTHTPEGFVFLANDL